MSALLDFSPHDATCRLLLELGVPPHRVGFRQLCIAIPYFSKNKNQSLTKELYPYIAETLGCSDWRAVEQSIRQIIVDTWKMRNVEIWTQYFPYCRKPPSSKRFIATLAEYIE